MFDLPFKERNDWLHLITKGNISATSVQKKTSKNPTLNQTIQSENTGKLDWYIAILTAMLHQYNQTKKWRV